jgi:hypothetical protein
MHQEYAKMKNFNLNNDTTGGVCIYDPVKKENA